MLLRILITGLVVAIILFIFGARGAAHSVLNWTLTIVKWIFIVGGVILVSVLFFSRKK